MTAPNLIVADASGVAARATSPRRALRRHAGLRLSVPGVNRMRPAGRVSAGDRSPAVSPVSPPLPPTRSRVPSADRSFAPPCTTCGRPSPPQPTPPR